MEEIRSTKDDMPNKDSGVICEICGNSIDENEEIELCPECVSPFHKECWDKRGGCGNPKCSSFVKPVDESKKATAKVVSVIIGKAKESLAKEEFDKALEFYKKALEYDSENVESINGLILAENSVCSTKELSEKGIEFEKSDSYKTYAEKLPEKNKKILEEIIQNRSQSKEKKKKKRKTVLISVSSALAVILVAVCIWFATPMSRFNFEINENSVEITGVKFKNIRNAVIPEKIFGKPVTSIGYGAFMDCQKLKRVTIPSSITSISWYAFDRCNSLERVDISDIGAWCNIYFSLQSTNPLSFAKNLYLNGKLVTDLVIPNSVTSIGAYTFYDYDKLTSVTIENNVTTIGERAFSSCDNLTSVTIGNRVTNIGRHSFYDCNSLASITIGDNVTTIGECAFSGCDNLTSVVIPNSVTAIGKSAFGECANLAIYYCEATSRPEGWDYNWNNVPNSYLESSLRAVIWDYKNNDRADNSKIYFTDDGITYSIYEGKASVERQDVDIITANIKEKISYKGYEYVVTSIGERAFNNCNGLTSVVIPNSVTTVGEYAFGGCSNIKELEAPTVVVSEIPKSSLQTVVINGGEIIDSFRGCTSLKSIVIPNSVTTIDEYAFWGCDGLTSIVIPNSVTSIGKNAFYNCRGLTSVTIGNNVTSIGEYAFAHCTSLTSVAIPNSVATIGDSAFYNCGGLTIYCEAILRPSGWSNGWNPSNRPVVWGSKGN